MHEPRSPACVIWLKRFAAMMMDLPVQMIRILLTTLGILLVLLGTIALLSPVPVGILIIALGCCLLVAVEPHARRIVKDLRSRNHALDRRVHWLETKIESRFETLHRALLETRPRDKHD
jgi:hypothetical protein